MKRTPLKRKTAIKYQKKAVPKEIRDHWKRVAALGCCISFSDQVQLHHCHGGSIRAKFGDRAMPGVGQKASDYLVIPLHPRYHTGELGIDSGTGVAGWEARHGSQLHYLEKVRQQIQRQYGYDILEKAGLL